jgi:hypothetical protein
LNIGQEFWDQDRKVYYLQDGKVGGYYQDNGHFTLMAIPNAGHFLPYF